MAQSIHGVAVIADIVDSRKQDDRVQAQRILGSAFEQLAIEVPAIRPMTPTVGDESQGIFTALSDAIRATLILRLLLPHGLDCRFGIGIGDYQELGPTTVGFIQDGPAWWSARSAIGIARQRQRKRNHTLRTWSINDGDQTDQFVNAYLLTRDELVSRMSPRSRRLLLGLLRGMTQAELAAVEQITTGGVNKNLQDSGAFAVLDGAELLAQKGTA